MRHHDLRGRNGKLGCLGIGEGPQISQCEYQGTVFLRQMTKVFCGSLAYQSAQDPGSFLRSYQRYVVFCKANVKIHFEGPYTFSKTQPSQCPM